MNIFGKVTLVGDLKEVATRAENSNNVYNQPLMVRGIEVKWFAPRSGQMGVRAGVVSAGIELRKEWATNCTLQPGDWICADVDLYGSHYNDSEGKTVCSSRLIANRYAVVTDFNELA